MCWDLGNRLLFFFFFKCGIWTGSQGGKRFSCVEPVKRKRSLKNKGGSRKKLGFLFKRDPKEVKKSEECIDHRKNMLLSLVPYIFYSVKIKNDNFEKGLKPLKKKNEKKLDFFYKTIYFYSIWPQLFESIRVIKETPVSSLKCLSDHSCL